MTDYISLGKEHIWLPYTQMQNALPQLEVKTAKGSKIFLKDGRILIDGIASWWTMAHGYNHPHIIKELNHQAKILPHIMIAGFANEATYKLAYRLTKIAPLDLNKVFFSDSGSTAVEVAMKIAWQFFMNKKKNKKIKFLSFYNSYHGDTSGCMSLSDLGSGMHQKFGNILIKNLSLAVPTNENELDKFEDFIIKNKNELAGVIIEPKVQCAGGMKFIDSNMLNSIYKITKHHQILFIADECANGFYRTGKIFACNHANITPDIMIVGKALTGGVVGLAATLTTTEIYNQFLGPSLEQALMHGPTFMGNPLACSAANASLDLFEQNDYELKVKKISKILNTELKKCQNLPNVKEVRICGAIAVIELSQITRQEILTLRKKFIEKGVFLRPFENIIYLMPALNISFVELKKLTDTIIDILS